MKIEKLIIHNIASIEDATIDFGGEPLVSSSLFLITGNTGSGKSTILDAICLALFAVTPRMNKNRKLEGKLKDGSKEIAIIDPLQLVRHGAKEAYVRLQFVGSDTMRYEAEWGVKAGRTNRNKYWRLVHMTHPEIVYADGSGTNTENDKIIREAIHQAVGLDFEQFCRTTMLAQGEFTRFLNSVDNEKADILEKVTGTGIYAKIGAKIFAITSQHGKSYEEALRKQESCHVLTAEERLAKEQERTAKQTEQASKQQVIQVETAKQQWLEQESSLLSARNKAETVYTNAQTQRNSEAYRQMVRTIQLWDETTDVRSQLRDLRTAQDDEQTQRATLQTLYTKYVQYVSGLVYLNDAIRLKEEQVKAMQEQLDAADCVQDLAEQRKELNRLQGLYGKLELASERVENLIKTRARRRKEEQALQEKRTKLDQLQHEIDTLHVRVVQEETRMNTCWETYNRHKDTITELAKTMRHSLHIGDTCPICGQTVQAIASNDAIWERIVNEDEHAYQEAKNSYDTLLKEEQQLKANQTVLQKQYDKDRQTYDNDSAESEDESKVRLSGSECGLTIGALTDETELKDLQTTIGTQCKDIKKDKQHLTEVINVREQIEKAQESLRTIREEQQRTQQASDAIVQSQPSWQQTLSDIPSKALSNTMNLMTSLQSDVSVVESLRKAASQRAQTIQQAIETYLKQHPDQTQAQLEALEQTKIDVLRKQKEDFDTNYTSYESLYKESVRLYDEHRKAKPELTEEDTVQLIRDRVNQITAERDELLRQIGTIDSELAQDDKAKAELQDLMQETEQKKQIYQQWKNLCRLVGDQYGTVFRKIAQGYILADLVRSANVYLQRLTNRYTLRSVPGTFIIMVEDAYQGFAARPASTISGGESFLVSLALALALSDIGQNLRVETLFIDEGFGTLSGEALQRAIQTLQSLRMHAGRQVGIISHVEELQECVPVQIRVEQNPQSSSSTIRVIPEITES